MPFPIYLQNAEVMCFHCGRVIGAADHHAQDAGWPTGRMRLRCDKCEMFTYFDVSKVALAAANN